MDIKAVIFDFNGTLFWDTPLHNRVWDDFLDKYKINLTDEEKHHKIHGKINRDILNGIFEQTLSEEEIIAYSTEKELAYQKVCIEKELQLAEGVEDFIFYLQDHKIDCTIATASDKINVDFYFDFLKLSRYFDYDKVVYNDGSVPGKPNPAMFLKAIQTLNVLPEESLIFEDSPTGIQAAISAKPAEVIIVNSTNTDYSVWSRPVITDFREAIQYLQ